MRYLYGDVLKKVDHTLLKVTAKEVDYVNLCKEAIDAKVFSVCVPPSFVSFCKEQLRGSRVKVCTVVGFPNGYSTVETKVFEAIDVLNRGVDEIDMVINVGFVKDKKYKTVEDEIYKVKMACNDRILKVIIETCYLTSDEKLEMCKVVVDSGADYIKTSTGFGTCGATFEDVSLIKGAIKEKIKIKVAGGVGDFESAKRYLELGASRIGSSKLAKLYNN